MQQSEIIRLKTENEQLKQHIQDLQSDHLQEIDILRARLTGNYEACLNSQQQGFAQIEAILTQENQQLKYILNVKNCEIDQLLNQQKKYRSMEESEKVILEQKLIDEIQKNDHNEKSLQTQQSINLITLQQQYEELFQKLENKFNNREAELKAYYENDLQVQLHQAQNQSTHLNVLQNQNTKLQNRIVEVEEQLQKFQFSDNQQSKAIKVLNDQILEYQAISSNQQAEINRLISIINQKDSEMQSMKSGANMIYGQYESGVNELLDINRQLKQTIHIIEREKQDLLDAYRKIDKQISEQQQYIQQLEAKLENGLSSSFEVISKCKKRIEESSKLQLKNLSSSYNTHVQNDQLSQIHLLNNQIQQLEDKQHNMSTDQTDIPTQCRVSQLHTSYQ